MPLIVFTSRKGGTGRTTAAWSLVFELLARKSKVLMISIGPRQPFTFDSAWNWPEHYDPAEVRKALAKEGLGNVHIKTVGQSFDDAGRDDEWAPNEDRLADLMEYILEGRRAGAYIIIDGILDEPSAHLALCLAADLCLICVGPSRLDAFAAHGLRNDLDRFGFEHQLSTLTCRYLACRTADIQLSAGREYLGLPSSEFLIPGLAYHPAFAEALALQVDVTEYLQDGLPDHVAARENMVAMADEIIGMAEGRDNIFTMAGIFRDLDFKAALTKDDRQRLKQNPPDRHFLVPEDFVAGDTTRRFSASSTEH